MPAQLAPGRLETEQVGDILVVRFIQRALVDDAVIRRLGQHLTCLVQESGHRNFVLDLGEVQRMSSVMIGQLLAAAGRRKRRPAAWRCARYGPRWRRCSRSCTWPPCCPSTAPRRTPC